MSQPQLLSAQLRGRHLYLHLVTITFLFLEILVLVEARFRSDLILFEAIP